MRIRTVCFPAELALLEGLAHLCGGIYRLARNVEDDIACSPPCYPYAARYRRGTAHHRSGHAQAGFAIGDPVSIHTNPDMTIGVPEQLGSSSIGVPVVHSTAPECTRGSKRHEWRFPLPVSPQKNTEISPLFKCDRSKARRNIRG